MTGKSFLSTMVIININHYNIMSKSDSKGQEGGQDGGNTDNTNDNTPDNKQADTKSDSSKGNSYKSEVEDLRKQLQGRDKSYTELSKKTESLEGIIKNLRGALSPESQDDGSDDPNKVAESLMKEVGELRGKLDRAEAVELLRATVKGFKLEDGKEIPKEIQELVLEDLEVSKPDAEEIQSAVSRKVNLFMSKIGDRFNKTPDRRSPNRAGFSGSRSHQPSANEILDSLK